MENKILFRIDLYKKKKKKQSNQKFPSKDLSFEWIHEIRRKFYIIFDYPGRRLSLSILSLSLFDRNNFSNERAIYDRGEIVMGN